MTPERVELTDTRAKIMDAAARLFVERGYAATSVRDIAAAIGVSNPSLYHHFASKGDLLEQLLAEPLARSQQAVQEAMLLSGDARTRRILSGLLEALEVHNGVAVGALRHGTQTPELALAKAARPLVYNLLLQEAAPDDADLRVRMVLGAVESVVTDLMMSAADGEGFVADLRARRDSIVDLALGILRPAPQQGAKVVAPAARQPSVDSASRPRRKSSDG